MLEGLGRFSAVLWACALCAASAGPATAAALAPDGAPRSLNVQVDAATTLHVLDTGPRPADAATLVLIPGWRFTASIWSPQIAAFAPGRRVIAIDPRSQGDSTKTPDGDTPEQRARDLHVLLGRLGAGHCVLVGWSQGVQDVAAYIQQFGTSDVDGVVLVDSTISAGASGVAASSDFAVQQLRLLPLLSASPRDYTDGMMQAVITRPMSAAERGALVDQALKTPTAIGEAMLVADLFTVDRRPALAKIDRPLLVIASPRSAELAQQKAMASRVANAQFEVVDQAGHAVFVDQPDRFNALLRAFLMRLSP
jgi:microsomal epoxide hydrolase